MGFFDRVTGRYKEPRLEEKVASQEALLFTDGKGDAVAELVLPPEASGEEQTVQVGIAESKPVSVRVTDPEQVQANLDLHQERPDTASLEITLHRLEEQERDINQPVWMLNNIKKQITATQEQIAATKPLAEEKVSVGESRVKAKGAVINPEPVVDNTDNTGKDAIDAIRQLRSEQKKEKEKKDAGVNILQEENRIDALKKNIAAIGEDIKSIDDQIAHREPQATSGRRKKIESVDTVLGRLREQSVDLKTKAVSFGQRLNDSERARQEAVNKFLNLGGSEKEIERLIQENITPENRDEKTVVIEPSELASELALDIPQTLALGVETPVVKDLVEGVVAEGVPIEGSQQSEKEGTLEERITAARLAYVTKDVEVTAKWKSLVRSFTWLKKPEDQDLVMLRQHYRSLLAQKKDEEISSLAPLGETERAGAMRELGKYFLMAEGAALGNLYAEEEKKTLSGKLGTWLDKIGEQYNNLSIGKKAALAVILFGSSVALAATPGAGIAIGGIALRRFCAGLGGAVALDTAAEKFLSGRQEKKVNAEIENFIETEEHTSPEEFAKRLNEFLDLDSQSIDKQIDKKRTKTFFRKWSLRVGGAFGGLALTEYLSHLRDATTVVTPGAEIVTGVTKDIPLPVNTPTMSYEVGGGASAMPAEYELTGADSQKGLWGVLEKSLPADMDEAQKTKAITSLQKLIATKLEALSPADQEAIGFRSGDINTIYAGDTLKLDGLVSQSELQEVLNGKDITASSIEAPTPEVASDAGIANNEVASVNVPEQAVADTGESSSVESEVSDEPVDGTAKLIGEGRIERAVYYKELEDTRRTIFATNDLRFRDSILNAPTVKMTDVVLAAKTPGETLVENQALLGTDQITRVNRFKELAVNAYGKVAEPGRNETIAAYTRRMVTLGFESPENKFNLDKLARV